jgi:hypothetical protein
MQIQSFTRRFPWSWSIGAVAIASGAACSPTDVGQSATTTSDGQGGQGGSGGAAGTSGNAGQAGASGGGTAGAGGTGPSSPANVVQFHNDLSRDGHYVDAAFTQSAAMGMHKDPSFNATIQGPTFAQPLYFEGVAGGKNIVLVATLSNWIYALDATSGAVVWKKQVAMPAPKGDFGCIGMDMTSIGIGIVGTPVIDAASKTVFFDAAEPGPIRRIHRWSLDDGSEQAGWPVDVVAAASASGTAFDPHVQSQRAAPTLVGGRLYVPYGGIAGDCGNYHGWVLGIDIANPTMTKAFATAARGGGIWGPGGLASDGSSVFATTGNTCPPGTGTCIGAPPVWGHGEAVLRFSSGPAYGDSEADYFRPSDWSALDNSDADIGGTGPILIDVPGATPSKLVVAIGKSGVVYLLDRTNLGGQGTGNGMTGEGVSSAPIASKFVITAPASYTSTQGTYVVFRGAGMGCPPGQSGDLTAVKISATAPPRASVAWCAVQNGRGSPMATTTDGQNDAIVWTLGAALMGFDGDTGATLFDGTSGSNAIAPIRAFSTPIAARGRIYVATDTNVYAFTMR